MANYDEKTLQFFSNYPNQPFEFVLVTDINVKEHPNYYKAIFKNIRTGRHHSVPLIPEMMRYKYKVGHIYTDGKHVGQNASIAKSEFRVNTDPTLPLKRISTVMTEEELNHIIDYDQVNKYFLRQYAHIEEQDEYTLVIPCYAIANRFYFISSSMKQAVMNGALDELYYPGSFHHEENEDGDLVVKLHIKSKANKKDLPALCRFIGSSFAQKRFEYLSSLKAFSQYEYQPIKAQFPTKLPFDVYASYIYYGNDVRGKPKYLFLNIHSENSPFGFNEIFYKKYSSKEDPKSIAPGQYGVPRIPPRKFKKKRPPRNNTIYTGVPSSEYQQYILRPETTEQEYFDSSVNISGKTLYQPNESEPSLDYPVGRIGNSFENPAADGDENLGGTSYAEDTPPENEKIPFNLQDFFQFYEALLSFAYVDGTELKGPFSIDKIKNSKRKTYRSKSVLNGNEFNARRFLFGQFMYDGKTVYIVEIEQDQSWTPSTWLFIGNIDLEYNHIDMRDIIEHYIDNDMTYIKLTEYLLGKYQLYFVQKEHKKASIDDDSIERWCESILKKVKVSSNNMTH